MKLRGLVLLSLFALTISAQRRMGSSNVTVAVPADPHELVVGQVYVPGAGERGTDMETLQTALQNSRMQISGTAPYRLDATFNSADAGQGTFTQTWLNPQTWNWTARLGATTVVRGTTPQSGAFADSAAAVPTVVHLLRNAIFSSMYDIAMGTQLRAARVTLNGNPATCMMTSGVAGPAAYEGRLWEELEYCFDASGRLVISSFAPGVFTVYSYGQSTAFHGHLLPDHMTLYSGGKQVLEASLQIADAAGTDPSSLAPAPGMTQRASVLGAPVRQPMPIPAPAGVTKVMPVLVHASLVDGKVVGAEVCAASDPALGAAAIEFVKQLKGGDGLQQQTYYMVKFVPAN